MNTVTLPEECVVETFPTHLEQTIPELCEFHMEESAEEVVISGTTASYYGKQMVQEAVRSRVGSRRLRNCIAVRR
jgi:hypothetical protein